MKSVLNLILTHQSNAAVLKMIEYWRDCVDPDSIAIAHGGTRPEFEALQHTQKIFIDDPALRTKDHQRDFQSYTGIVRAAANFLKAREDFKYLHLIEYDHIPLTADLNQRQIDRLHAEQADVIGFHLQRIDSTSNPHFLYHVRDDRFRQFFHQISRRSDPSVVLSMFGTGSVWTREAISEIARVEQPFPIYLEVYLPTLAHHLGFRLRGLSEQDKFVRALDNQIPDIKQAKGEGAWTLHPIKNFWDKT